MIAYADQPTMFPNNQDISANEWAYKLQHQEKKERTGGGECGNIHITYIFTQLVHK